MKVVLFLAAILSVDAANQEERAQCALDGAKAASELSDVVVYLWAATSRCTQDNLGPPNGNMMSAKCAVDISAVIKAVNDMVLIVVKAVNDCADLKTTHYECGMAVGKLTSASAGISEATANTVHHCPSVTIQNVPSSDSPNPAGLDNGGYTDVGKCVVNVKAAASGLFEATLEASKIKSTCAGDQVQCGRNSLHLVTAVGKIGSAIGLGINKCEQAAGKAAGNQDSACFGAITQAVSEIVKATDAGLVVAKKCTASDARLFELEGAAQPPQSQPTNTVLVAALIPLFAVLSFVAGAKFRMGHLHPSERSRAMHSLVEGETTESDI
jgi:hypothetical protein